MVPPETDCAAPLKTTVPLPALNMPLLLQLPLTVKIGVPVMVRVSPVAMVMLRQNAAALIAG